MDEEHARLRRQVEQLRSLLEVSSSVAAQLELEPLLQSVVDTATRLAEAEMGGLFVLGTEPLYEYFKVSGWPHEPRGFPAGRGLFRLPYETGRPLRLDDVTRDPRAAGVPAGHPPVRAFLGVPLRIKDRILGTLFVSHSAPGMAFSAEQEELLAAFSVQAAIAIENARLYAQAEELAVLRERHRLARELHDQIAQTLYSLGLEVAGCLEGPQPRCPRTDRIRVLAARASGELRDAIFALSWGMEEGDDLQANLRRMLRRFEETSGIAASAVLPRDSMAELPAPVRQAVLRIVSEALSNVRKHARAHRAVVTVDLASDRLLLSVLDDGVGLVGETAEGGSHFGLRSMRETAEELGGRMQLVNQEDGGLAVKVELPWPR